MRKIMIALTLLVWMAGMATGRYALSEGWKSSARHLYWLRQRRFYV